MSYTRSRSTRITWAVCSTWLRTNSLCLAREALAAPSCRGITTTGRPRLGLAYQVSPKLVVRGGYGLFYAMRDQNQSVTQFSGNTPNVPTVSLPPISATETVTPPYTINTPITVLPATTTLDGFTPTKPYSVEIKTQSLNNALMPRLYQYNLDLQYQTHEQHADRNLLQRRPGTRPGFLVHRWKSGSLFGRVRRTKQTGQSSLLKYRCQRARCLFQRFLKLQRSQRQSATADGPWLAFLANYSWQKNIESQGTGPDSYNQNGGTSIALDTYDLIEGARRRTYQRWSNLYHQRHLRASLRTRKALHLGRRSCQRLLGGWVVNGILTLRGGFPTDIRTNVLPPVFNTFNVASCVPGVPLKLPNAGVDG